MKVKISYTVDVESIPNEIQNLVDKISVKKSDLDKQYSKLETAFKYGSLEKGLPEIESLRTTMFDLDVLLQDLDAISAGYLSIISTRQPTQDIEKDPENAS